MRGAVKTKSPYDHAYVPDIRAAHPRQLGNWAARFSYTPHPPPDPSGSRPPRAPWTVTRDRRDRPHPAAIISRCSATASGDARHCRCRGATPDTPRSAYRARGPGSRGALGTSYLSAGPTRTAPQAPPRSLRDARATITHSGHTFTLDSALSSETSLTPSRDSAPTLSLALNSSTQPLILTHNASTHSHSLTQTHPLTHSHASTHLPLTLTHWRCVSMRTSLGVVERVA
jgi:hypothetical protein